MCLINKISSKRPTQQMKKKHIKFGTVLTQLSKMRSQNSNLPLKLKKKCDSRFWIGLFT